jgi:multicomponent Na+:H+ antiporter subunit D
MDQALIGVGMILVVSGMGGVAACRGIALIFFCTLGQLGSALAGAGTGLDAGAGLEVAARQAVSAAAALIMMGLSLAVAERAERTSKGSRIGLPTFSLAVGVYSLAGLPPTDGFFSRILIYESGMRSGDSLSRLAVVLVALFSLIWLVRGSELISSARRAEKTHGTPVARKGETFVLVLLICFVMGGGLFPGAFSQVWRLIVAPL